MLIPLLGMLPNHDHKLKKINNNIIQTKNFKLTQFNDSRYDIYKYLDKIKKFDHFKVILFNYFNSVAVNKFLNHHIVYSEIVPYSLKKINQYSKNKQVKLRNLDDILKLLKDVKKKFS